MDPAARRVLQSLLEAGVRHAPLGAPLLAPVEPNPAREPAAESPPPSAAAPASHRTGSTAAASAASASPAPPAAPAGASPAEAARVLGEVADEVAACRACGLCERRTLTVPGEGSPGASIVFVGEGPGADEDKSGRPFVGRAGQLLDDIITKGMKLRREDVFICNIVKCRPPGNRDPEPEEVAACLTFLERQLLAIGPRVICALGANAARTLLQAEGSLSRLRGRVGHWHGIPVIPTYHPAYLLREPSAKRPAWQDVQHVMELAAAP